RLTTGRRPLYPEPLLQLRGGHFLNVDASEAGVAQPGSQRLGPHDIIAANVDRESLRKRAAVRRLAATLARLERQQNLRERALGIGQHAQGIARSVNANIVDKVAEQFGQLPNLIRRTAGAKWPRRQRQRRGHRLGLGQRLADLREEAGLLQPLTEVCDLPGIIAAHPDGETLDKRDTHTYRIAQRQADDGGLAGLLL